MKRLQLTGKQFGRLVVTGYFGSINQNSRWECECECGNKVIVIGYELNSGHTKSCGCLRRDKFMDVVTKHGLRYEPLYQVWLSIKNRCNNKNADGYERYGGRGIEICREWEKDFKVFYDFCTANGWQPDLQIDRIENDGNYEPGNCRFVTNRRNCLNTRLLRSSNTSGYRGVSWNKKLRRWMSYLTVRGDQIRFGSFADKIKAVEARNNYIMENNLNQEYEVQVVQ